MNRSNRTGLVLTLFTLTVGKLSAGCGYTLTDARRDLTTGAQAQMEAQASWKQFDRQYQRGLTDVQLADYRAGVQPKIVSAFEALSKVTRATAEALNAYEDGKSGAPSIAAIVAPVFSAAAALYYALKAVGMDVPALRALAGVVQ